MKFSRVISFFILCVLLVAQVGIPVVSHWCGGSVQERSLVATSSCCCTEVDTNAMHDMASNDEDTDPCCHADTDIARADLSDQMVPSISAVPTALCVEMVEFFCPTTLLMNQTLAYSLVSPDSTPHDTSPPTPALLSVFRI